MNGGRLRLLLCGGELLLCPLGEPGDVALGALLGRGRGLLLRLLLAGLLGVPDHLLGPLGECGDVALGRLLRRGRGRVRRCLVAGAGGALVASLVAALGARAALAGPGAVAVAGAALGARAGAGVAPLSAVRVDDRRPGRERVRVRPPVGVEAGAVAGEAARVHTVHSCAVGPAGRARAGMRKGGPRGAGPPSGSCWVVGLLDGLVVDDVGRAGPGLGVSLDPCGPQ
ncbi:hypothetical protein SFR_1610 [Streptomyces sp. FR-008]|nr:hypothetical protein SFR_1610 [Streptomyces sp. FR-008]